MLFSVKSCVIYTFFGGKQHQSEKTVKNCSSHTVCATVMLVLILKMKYQNLF